MSFAGEIENIRISSFSKSAETEQTFVLENVRLIATTVFEGKTLQVDMIAPTLYCRREVLCSACNATGVRESQIAYSGLTELCAFCHGRGVR